MYGLPEAQVLTGCRMNSRDQPLTSQGRSGEYDAHTFVTAPHSCTNHDGNSDALCTENQPSYLDDLTSCSHAASDQGRDRDVCSHSRNMQKFRRARQIAIFVLLAFSFHYLRKGHFLWMLSSLTETEDIRQKEVVSPRKLILLSYQRCGSSFLGSLFSSNPEVCYWFEPVAGILFHIYGFTSTLHPLDIYYGEDSKENIPEYEVKSLLHYLPRLLSNAPSKIPLEFLYNRFNLYTSVPWSTSVRKCIANFTGIDRYRFLATYKTTICGCNSSEPQLCQLRHCYSTKSTQQLQNETLSTCFPGSVQCHRKCVKTLKEKTGTCVDVMEDWCKLSKVAVTKTVRLPMSTVEGILEENPDTRVVHYVRDPRGMYISKKEAQLISSASNGDWFREIELYCIYIMDNILATERISLKYPEKVMTLRYEDLAERPLRYAEKLYSFINISFSVSVQDRISKITHAPEDTGRFGTSRKNSYKTSRAWMTKISESEVKLINERCGAVLGKLGYAQEEIIKSASTLMV